MAGSAETKPRPSSSLLSEDGGDQRSKGKRCHIRCNNVYKLRQSRVRSCSRQDSLCWLLSTPGKSPLMRWPSGREQVKGRNFGCRDVGKVVGDKAGDPAEVLQDAVLSTSVH